MGYSAFLHLWSNRKLAFISTTCPECGHPIATQKVVQEFLRDMGNKIPLNSRQIQHGQLGLGGVTQATLLFDDFNYKNNSTCVRGVYFQIGWVSFGKNTGLESPGLLGGALQVLHKILVVLHEYFPKQKFWWDVTAEWLGDPQVLPMTEVSLDYLEGWA